LWPLLFSFALGYAIKNDQANHDGLKLNSTFQRLIYSEEFILLGKKMHSIIKTQNFELVVNEQICHGPNAEKIKYMLMPVVRK
jgi:hypothetical protein